MYYFELLQIHIHTLLLLALYALRIRFAHSKRRICCTFLGFYDLMAWVKCGFLLCFFFCIRSIWRQHRWWWWFYRSLHVYYICAHLYWVIFCKRCTLVLLKERDIWVWTFKWTSKDVFVFFAKLRHIRKRNSFNS